MMGAALVGRGMDPEPRQDNVEAESQFLRPGRYMRDARIPAAWGARAAQARGAPAWP
jgi:hypothetical protein